MSTCSQGRICSPVKQTDVANNRKQPSTTQATIFTCQSVPKGGFVAWNFLTSVIIKQTFTDPLIVCPPVFGKYTTTTTLKLWIKSTARVAVFSHQIQLNQAVHFPKLAQNNFNLNVFACFGPFKNFRPSILWSHYYINQIQELRKTFPKSVLEIWIGFLT